MISYRPKIQRQHTFTGLIFKCLPIFIVLFSSCSKEFINPYDPATLPDVWMPQAFKLDTLSSNTLRLSWEQEILHFDGFTLVKRKNGNENAIELDKSARTYQDNVVLDSAEMSICTPVSYSIFARAGGQKSSAASLPEELFFPQPIPVNAGLDIEATTLSVNLAAILPVSAQSGKWTILSGEGGVIADLNSPSSLFTGQKGQTYILEWEVVLSCNSVSTDQVVVTFPISVAGEGVTDIDGNNYPTQIIGEQEWMIGNLTTTRYKNGDTITNLTNPAEWATTIGAWCHYDNSVVNATKYGKLYNWFAVADPRGLCPAGWHVPSDEEWTELIDYLGGPSIAGGKMKSMMDWNPPNTVASNESGFSGLPGGTRNFNGVFNLIGYYGYWWSSTEYDTSFAWNRYLTYNSGNASRSSFNKLYGFLVRCIRD